MKARTRLITRREREGGQKGLIYIPFGAHQQCQCSVVASRRRNEGQVLYSPYTHTSSQTTHTVTLPIHLALCYTPLLHPSATPPPTTHPSIHPLTMRSHLLLLALAPRALVSAFPNPQASTLLPSSTAPVLASTSLNIPVTSVPVPPTDDAAPPLNASSTSKRRWSHYEPIPVFSKQCDCPVLTKGSYPCWATDAVQVRVSHTQII